MNELALELINECITTQDTYLDLSYCGLTDADFIEGSPVDKALRQCRHLQVLSFVAYKGDIPVSVLKKNRSNYNSITIIPGALIALTNLAKLTLSGERPDGNSRISELNGSRLPANLHYLNLSDNDITQVYDLAKLTSLQYLNLSHNSLFEIHGIEQLTTLQYLNLSNNEINEIKGLDHLHELEELNLSNNKISTIAGIDNLPCLKRLNVSYNQIKQLDGLINIKQKLKLLIHNNELESIGLRELNEYFNSGFDYTIEDLKYIKNFVVKNQIFEWAPPVRYMEKKMAAGETISPEENKEIDEWFFKLQFLTNPLISPSIEILSQGMEATLNYLKESEKQGVEYLYEAKMLIVGQPRAGKTSLRYKLIDKSATLPEEDKTTRGIDIKQLSFDVVDKNGKVRKFNYNIWDFGGQQIYQTTHQFFLTHRSLYILVVDTGKDSIGNDDATINYWLQAVELLGGNSPLLLIQNEKNERQIKFDLPQKKARFPFLKKDYIVDLNALIPGSQTYKNGRSIEFDNLKEDIETELMRLPLIGLPMPKNWFTIRNALQLLAKTESYISRDRYRSLCDRYGVTEFDRQMELSRIFHDLGVFLHFQDYATLEDFIILQNTWATDAVFAVLDNATVLANKGKFSDANLPAIWEPKGYGKEVHNKLLGLMMQFELCYQVEKMKPCAYIIPEMLPSSAPSNYSWQPNNDLPLQYRYDFMPKGLLTRLIVRLHKNIYSENNQQLVWKSGVKIDGKGIDCPSTFAEIIEAWDNKQLSLRVQGPFSKELISKISHEIDILNNEYFKQIDLNNESSRSKWHKMIPCNCITCKGSSDKYFFNYSKLLERKEFGKDNIECEKKPFASVSITELLDGVFTKEEPSKNNQPGSKKLFISYSKDDIKLVNKFLDHLSALEIDGKIAHWYCTALMAGTEWDDEIREKFNKADIVCFMVSPSFMATEYIHKNEIKRAFERRKTDKNLKIVPIILDFCSWSTQENNLAQFTALPYMAKPVRSFKNENQAWYIIERCLRLIIENDLHPTGNTFYTNRALPKDVLKIFEDIIARKVD